MMKINSTNIINIKIVIIFISLVLLLSVDYEYFQYRGFGTDHLYYRKIINSNDFREAFSIFISESASEPLSLMYFYLISCLPLDDIWKFDLARMIIYIVGIWNFRKQTLPLLFVTAIYFSPLMFTMFNSNLRQALAFSSLVFFITHRRWHIAFLTATMMHLSVLVVYLVANYRHLIVVLFIFMILFIVVFAIGGSSEVFSQWIGAVSKKFIWRIRVTEIQNLGYLIHLFFALIIFLVMNQKFLVIKKSDLFVSISIFIIFICFIFFNNVAQRLVVYVWLLPILKLSACSVPSNIKKIYVPLFIVIMYSSINWFKVVFI